MAASQLDSSERDRVLREHVDDIYADLTDGYCEALRVEDLVVLAGERYPGLLPGRDAMAEEAGRMLAEKRGLAIEQGAFLSRVLASERPGRHLVHAMLRPRPEALAALDDFRRTGRADLGPARVERHGHVGQVELANLRFLNAEDDAATAALELAVDLVLLDPEIEVGVIRGAVADHPKYAGRRVFNSGINLTHLYHGRIDFVGFFIARELGLLGKLYRGHWLGDDFEAVEDTVEKPWIAAVESHAVGGGTQLLLVVDRVLAEQGSFFSLPARSEGIIPGTSNRRLTRFVGDRIARQLIMFGRRLEAGTPEGALLCDDVVEPDAMDDAIRRDADLLVDSGTVSAAANRKAIRMGEETVDEFRLYEAMYCREQARCLRSPALIANLERNWRARERRV